MSLLNKLLSRKPSWQFRAGGTVWKLLGADSMLLVDVRDTEKRTASFVALDVQSGRTLWNYPAPQGWWIGMQTVIADTLLLHGFEKPDMPIPKGMYAIDVHTGESRWSDPDLTYLFTANGRVYAHRAAFRSRTFAEIDPHTGTVAYDYGENEEGVMKLRAVAGNPPDDPAEVFAESLHACGDEVRSRVERAVDLSRVRGVVDVAEAQGRVIVALHEPARGADAMLNNRVMNVLKVVGANDAIVFTDTIVADAPAPVPDVFFVKNGVLLYVKDTTIVVGVRLSDLPA